MAKLKVCRPHNYLNWEKKILIETFGAMADHNSNPLQVLPVIKNGAHWKVLLKSGFVSAFFRWEITLTDLMFLWFSLNTTMERNYFHCCVIQLT